MAEQKQITEVARQWFAKARNDLLNADNNLNSITIPFDTVCFHFQQAADDWFMPSKEDSLEARESAYRVLEWFKTNLPLLSE